VFCCGRASGLLISKTWETPAARVAHMPALPICPRCRYARVADMHVCPMVDSIIPHGGVAMGMGVTVLL
jgi:hypothetical protein